MGPSNLPPGVTDRMIEDQVGPDPILLHRWRQNYWKKSGWGQFQVCDGKHHSHLVYQHYEAVRVPESGIGENSDCQDCGSNFTAFGNDSRSFCHSCWDRRRRLLQEGR